MCRELNLLLEYVNQVTNILQGCKYRKSLYMVKMCSTQNLQCSAQNLNPISKEGMLTQHCMSVFAFARALNPHSSIAFTVSSMVVRLFGRNQLTIRILLCFVNNKVFQLKLIKNVNTYNNAKTIIVKSK